MYAKIALTLSPLRTGETRCSDSLPRNKYREEARSGGVNTSRCSLTLSCGKKDNASTDCRDRGAYSNAPPSSAGCTMRLTENSELSKCQPVAARALRREESRGQGVREKSRDTQLVVTRENIHIWSTKGTRHQGMGDGRRNGERMQEEEGSSCRREASGEEGV